MTKFIDNNSIYYKSLLSPYQDLMISPYINHPSINIAIFWYFIIFSFFILKYWDYFTILIISIFAIYLNTNFNIKYFFYLICFSGCWESLGLMLMGSLVFVVYSVTISYYFIFIFIFIYSYYYYSCFYYLNLSLIFCITFTIISVFYCLFGSSGISSIAWPMYFLSLTGIINGRYYCYVNVMDCFLLPPINLLQ